LRPSALLVRQLEPQQATCTACCADVRRRLPESKASQLCRCAACRADVTGLSQLCKQAAQFQPAVLGCDVRIAMGGCGCLVCLVCLRLPLRSGWINYSRTCPTSRVAFVIALTGAVFPSPRPARPTGHVQIICSTCTAVNIAVSMGSISSIAEAIRFSQSQGYSE
jgi:hypothetical protein